MLKTCFIILTLLFLSSCNSEEVENEDELKVTSKSSKEETLLQEKEAWENYMIPAGEHENIIKSFSLTNADSLNVLVKFDSTAIYSSANPENQHDWNKLIGFSDCGSHHMKNSIRIVWRWSGENGIELGKYLYQEGNRFYESLQTIEVGETVQLALSVKKEEYIIAIDNSRFSHPRICNSRFMSYILYPYFGGNEIAPQNINHFILQKFP